MEAHRPAPTARLGRYVRRLRRQRRMSLRGVAAAAKVTPTWLSLVEQGQYESPDARLLARVAAVLEIDPSSLYIEAGYTSGTSLPELAPYLRAKYDLSPAAVAEIGRFFDQVNRTHPPRKGR